MFLGFDPPKGGSIAGFPEFRVWSARNGAKNASLKKFDNVSKFYQIALPKIE